jgi:Cupredoxin-like domain
VVLNPVLLIRRLSPASTCAAVIAIGWFLLPLPVLAQNPTFAISIFDDRFEPSELHVPANQKIELHVKNERKATSEFESTELRREKIVLAGQEVTVYVGPLRPGTYEFFDDFHPQTRGHLIVR